MALQSNSQVMRSAVGAGIAANQWVPIVIGLITAVAVSTLPLLCLFIPTPLVGKALSAVSGFFLFLCFWGVCDAMIQAAANEYALNLFGPLRLSNSQMLSMLNFPTQAEKVYGMFGYLRSAGMMLSVFLTGLIVRFGGHALSALGSNMTQSMQGAGAKAGELGTSEGMASALTGLTSGQGHLQAFGKVPFPNVTRTAEARMLGDVEEKMGALAKGEPAYRASARARGADATGSGSGLAKAFGSPEEIIDARGGIAQVKARAERGATGGQLAAAGGDYDKVEGMARTSNAVKTADDFGSAEGKLAVGGDLPGVARVARTTASVNTVVGYGDAKGKLAVDTLPGIEKRAETIGGVDFAVKSSAAGATLAVGGGTLPGVEKMTGVTEAASKSEQLGRAEQQTPAQFKRSGAIAGNETRGKREAFEESGAASGRGWAEEAARGQAQRITAKLGVSRPEAYRLLNVYGMRAQRESAVGAWEGKGGIRAAVDFQIDTIGMSRAERKGLEQAAAAVGVGLYDHAGLSSLFSNLQKSGIIQAYQRGEIRDRDFIAMGGAGILTEAGRADQWRMIQQEFGMNPREATAFMAGRDNMKSISGWQEMEKMSRDIYGSDRNPLVSMMRAGARGAQINISDAKAKQKFGPGAKGGSYLMAYGEDGSRVYVNSNGGKNATYYHDTGQDMYGKGSKDVGTEATLQGTLGGQTWTVREAGSSKLTDAQASPYAMSVASDAIASIGGIYSNKGVNNDYSGGEASLSVPKGMVVGGKIAAGLVSNDTSTYGIAQRKDYEVVMAARKQAWNKGLRDKPYNDYVADAHNAFIKSLVEYGHSRTNFGAYAPAEMWADLDKMAAKALGISLPKWLTLKPK